MVTLSPTLGINERIRALRAEGRRIHHLGFGESPFPTPARLAAALREHAAEKAYLPVAGLPELRRAVADHQSRLTGHDPDAHDVIVAPGSKLVLFAVQMALPGDLLLPVPSWVSYAPQAALLEQRVVPVPTRLDDTGYRIDADALGRCIAEARAEGLNPTKLLVNFPNNPTGLTIDDATLAALAEVCRAERVALISDEIYGRVSYDGRYRSAAPLRPEGTIVTTGLSKHLSLGGWRLGVGLIPKAMSGLFERVAHIASETWSCVAAPVQIAAIEAYAGHEDVEAYVRDTCAVHARVNGALARGLRALGVDCPLPQGGFYVWPDFGDALGGGAASGSASGTSSHESLAAGAGVGRRPAGGGVVRGPIGSSDDLAAALLDEAGIATLPGRAFGERPGRLTLRLAACDYDGAAALERRRASPDADGETLAPELGDALAAFERFLAGRRRRDRPPEAHVGAS